MMKILSSLIAMFISSKSMGFSGGGGGGGFDLKKIQSGIIDDIALRLRKPVTLILLGVCATFFFCGGLFMALIDATLQYDKLGTVYGTATLWAGLILAAVTAGGYTYIFTQQWPGAKKENAQKKTAEQAAKKEEERMQQEHHRPSSFDGALAELLMDFVEGRRTRREQRFSEREHRREERDARRAAREARREQRRQSESHSGESFQDDTRH
ncbi:hypothetical protein [Bdellovibrio sp. HCB288]|uniref:hypothetical protein n=1 Tax=Bdellovibrio sp. HCB288 TaxID=3394355 RepID=UPI0039B4E346